MDKPITQQRKLADINIEAIISELLKIPGIKIDREKFLRSSLDKKYPQEIIDKAIQETPAAAGLTTAEMNTIASAAITGETVGVTLVSAAAGSVGGIGMLASIPTDISQFFIHIIRIAQKLAYCYGWFDFSKEIDDETKNILILFIGIMLGDQVATKTISSIVQHLSPHLYKQLMRSALTKGTIYPIVKQVAKVSGFKMTKEVFAKGITGKIIPVIGAVVSGGITLASYLPMAKKLDKYLSSLSIASPDFFK